MKLRNIIGLVMGLLLTQQALAQDSIRYGLEALYPPFESKAPDGKLVGFDIALGNAICKQAELKCSWVEGAFDTLIPALKARKFDVINSAMNITAQRAKAIDFTIPIYQVPTQLIVHKGMELLPNAKSLNGKNIGVLQGSIQQMYAVKHWQSKGVNVVAYKDQNQVYDDLISGRLDGTLVMSTAGQQGFLNKPEGKDFQFVGKPVVDKKILGVGIGYGLRKGDVKLQKRLNKAIRAIQKEGKIIPKLSKEYFGGVDVSIHH